MSLQSHPLQPATLPLVHALTGPNGPAIEMRTSDGYVNATRMCQAAQKRWSNFQQLDGTSAFLTCLATKAGITVLDLVHSERGGCHTGTWVHPQVAIKLAAWCSPEFEVAVTDLVFRYCKGEVTTEESQNVAQSLRDAAGETWKPHSIGGVSIDITGNQLYLGVPAGTFVNLRNMGTRLTSAPGVDSGVIIKFGKSEDMSRRNPQHGAAFGGFRLLDHFPVKDPAASEKRLKKRLDACGMRLRGKHSQKQVEDTELVHVSSQQEYNELYDLAAWAAGEQEDIGLQLEHEKTEQMRLELEMKRMDHEWRMVNFNKHQETNRAELNAGTNLLEEFVQSGHVVFEPGSYMKLSDLREGIKAQCPMASTTMDSLRDVFQPRGVTFPLKGKRVIPGTDKSSITQWVDNVRPAGPNGPAE